MLINKKEIEVRFHEVDSLRIVWHGHFINYFEIGREAFGKEYGLTYMQVYDHGFFMPIVKINCDYKSPIIYEDILIVETAFQNTPTAKIIFNYTIRTKESGIVNAKGYSEQVFIGEDNQLHLTIPPFFAKWKKEHGLKA